MNIRTITITLATVEDAQGIHQIMREGWRAFTDEQKGPTAEHVEARFNERVTPTRIAQRLQNGMNVLIARQGQSIVGMVSWEEFDGRIYPAVFAPHNAAAALALMRSARKFMDSSKDWVAIVVEHNEHAIRLYEKLGFKRTNREPRREEWKTSKGVGSRTMIEMIRPASRNTRRNSPR